VGASISQTLVSDPDQIAHNVSLTRLLDFSSSVHVGVCNANAILNRQETTNLRILQGGRIEQNWIARCNAVCFNVVGKYYSGTVP
jgi:hypothetical protein